MHRLHQPRQPMPLWRLGLWTALLYTAALIGVLA